MSRHSYAAWKNCRSNCTIIELQARRANGGGVPDVMLQTRPRLGLRAARHERGTGTLVVVGEERNVRAVEGGSERRTPHAVT